MATIKQRNEKIEKRMLDSSKDAWIKAHVVPGVCAYNASMTGVCGEMSHAARC